MRRTAGSFVRRRIVDKASLLLVVAGMCFGFTIAVLIKLLIGPLVSDSLIVIAYVLLAVASSAVVLKATVSRSRWSLDNLAKGKEAEIRVGEIIEYAITAEGCAVAHSVTEIAKVGDIDHIVATPVGIWVIETKYKKVPKKYFPEVLSRVAANIASVRRWAPSGTPVKGCLVLPYEDTKKIRKKEYTHKNEKIAVYGGDSLASLMHEIRREARGKRTLDERIAKDIWKLGHVDDRFPK